jgi:hypothetical protein
MAERASVTTILQRGVTSILRLLRLHFRAVRWRLW